MTDLWNKYLRYLFPLRVINGNVGHKVKQNQKHEDKQLNIFKEYDTDNDGYISLLDLRITGAVKGFGEVIDFLMEQYDMDKDNQLSYQGNVGHKVKQNEKHEDKQLGVFKEYDTDNNGYISLHEFRITGSGKGFGEYIEQLMREFDTDKDNQISYNSKPVILKMLKKRKTE